MGCFIRGEKMKGKMPMLSQVVARRSNNSFNRTLDLRALHHSLLRRGLNACSRTG
jgi:hypothetical protein